MASTAISNIIVPSIFAPYALERALTKNAIIESGLVAINPGLSAKLAAGGGLTFNFPSFQNVSESSTAANVSSSVAATSSTAEGLTARSNIAVRNERNKTWSSADLTASVAGANPLDALGQMVGDAIKKWRTATLMATLQGVVNETNMSTSVNTIASETLVSPYLAATSFTAGALIDTMAVWGDSVDSDAVPFLVMHSDVKRYLMKTEPNSFVPVSQTNVFFPLYLGFPVLTDDVSTKRAGTTSGTVYTTYLVKPSAIEMGVGAALNPVASERNEKGGNGGGVDELTFRDAFTFHIVGTKFLSASVAADLPTDAELATAANWGLAYSAKAIGVAALVHNLIG